MSKILITGSCGFIGSNYIRSVMQNKQHSVVCVDKVSDLAMLNNYYFNKNLNFQFMDITSKDLLHRLFLIEKPDVIVHLAESYTEDNIKQLSNNILGMQTLIDVAQEHKVSKFIYISSTDLYNSNTHVNEDAAINANSLCKMIQSSNEQLLKNSGLQHLILRAPIVYGPREQKENLIPNVIKSIMNQQQVVVYGSQSERDWLYVTELCDAINTLMDKSGIYNISTQHEIPINEFLQKVCNVLNQGWELIQYSFNDSKYTTVSNSKAIADGWEPKLKLSKAIENTVVWYKNNAWAIK